MNPSQERWKLTEYWFRRENSGKEEHFKLAGLTTTSLKLILEEVKDVMLVQALPLPGC